MHPGTATQVTKIKKSYHVATAFDKFHFIGREAGHRDGLDSVWRIETSPAVTRIQYAHRLRIRILQILKILKIHEFFSILKCQQIF